MRKERKVCLSVHKHGVQILWHATCMIERYAAHKHDMLNLFACLIIPDDSGFTPAEALSVYRKLFTLSDLRSILNIFVNSRDINEIDNDL